MKKRYKVLLTSSFMLFVLLTWLIRFSQYREGIQVVVHYMFGNGRDYHLKSSAIDHSPVIQQRLKTMRVGQTVKVSFRQQEDWRLSYAINGFQLTKTVSGFKIYQFIGFDHTGNVYTDVHTPFGAIRVYDYWVHFVECKPFRLYYNSKF